MPKNKGKGGKNRKRGKNEADDEKRELVFKEDGQEYAQVMRMLGNGRCEALCIDGIKRLSHIRGKMHKKVWIAAGDIILVGLRDYQDDKADVILKYQPDEARLLKAPYPPLILLLTRLVPILLTPSPSLSPSSFSLSPLPSHSHPALPTSFALSLQTCSLLSHVDRSLSFMDHSVEHRFDYQQRAVNLDRELFLSKFPTLLHTHYHPHTPFLPLPTSYRQRAVNLDRALFQEHKGHKLMRDVRPAATRFHVFMGCNWIKASRPFLRYGSPPLDFSAARFNLQPSIHSPFSPPPPHPPLSLPTLSSRSPPLVPHPIKASRPFLRYVLWEPASWPRRILMYTADVIDSDEHYFSTVACPAPRFNHYLLNASLHFATFAKAQGQPSTY
ncbi:unnamed protein product [Closterium sp. NIES-64]|nr:unnamed protein product [Closterium sp. NIES-64]